MCNGITSQDDKRSERQKLEDALNRADRSEITKGLCADSRTIVAAARKHLETLPRQHTLKVWVVYKPAGVPGYLNSLSEYLNVWMNEPAAMAEAKSFNAQVYALERTIEIKL